MREINRLGVFTIYIGLSYASFSATASEDIDDELKRMVEGISEECHVHARVMTDAEWSAIERSGKAEGFSNQFKESLFRVTNAQCVLTQQILVLKAVREEITENEWVTLGGSESIQSLQEKLISTFPQ